MEFDKNFMIIKQAIVQMVGMPFIVEHQTSVCSFATSVSVIWTFILPTRYLELPLALTWKNILPLLLF